MVFSPMYDYHLRFLGLCAVNREENQNPLQKCFTSRFEYLEALMNCPSAEERGLLLNVAPVEVLE